MSAKQIALTMGEPIPLRYSFQVNDVFALHIKGEQAKECRLDQRYVIFQVMELYSLQNTKNNMVLRVKYTRDMTLPRTMEELERLPFFVFWRYPYMFRHLPFGEEEKPGAVIEPEYYQNTFVTDKSGRLPLYRMTLLPYGARFRPELIYLGSYPQLTPPRNEFVPKVKANIDGAAWNTLEGRLLFRFRAFNQSEEESAPPESQ